METTQLQSPAKRRRLSPPGISFTTDIPSQADTIHNQDLCGKIPHTDVQEENGDITMDASRVRLAGRNVAPFLAKHIPDQYAPLGAPEQHTDRDHKNHSSKFCYRHRPDLKCRRQANEPTMDQLQHVGHGTRSPTDASLTDVDRKLRRFPRLTNKVLHTCGLFSLRRLPSSDN